MSFDEYVNHISQKQRIAVAISVIKSKPKDISIDEYLTQLQQKIKDTEFDPNETVCSDDFKFDDDEIIDQNHREIPVNINGHQFDCKSNEAKINNSVVNESFHDNSPISQTILNDFVFGGVEATNDANVHGDCLENSLETLHSRQEATVNRKQQEQEQTSQHQNLSQLTYCESQALDTNYYNNNTTNCTTNNNNKHSINATENNRNLTNIDSQATELYSLEAFTQNYTHVSQTQGEQVIISDKFIRSNIANAQRAELNENSIATDSKEVNTKINDQQKQFTENDHNFSQSYDQIRIPVENVYNYNSGSANNIDINKEHEECINIVDYITIGNEELETNKNHTVHKHASVRGITTEARNDKFVNDNEMFEGDNDNDEHNEMEVDEKTDSDDNSTVKVPFKVLEELHRVKAFLNKKDRRCTDGYSTDSGYRSDSQVRNSFKNSFQSSIIWINQSAHCLFTYILQSPMDCGDIVNDISKVLGQLIDKLHEEENYPPFLEELLETVDSLIREAYGGDNWTEDALITKDENTYRLVLLNKSKHILKHSTETITDILEKLHSNLAQENYELTNTNQIENSCYIFHILEIFLKKYIKVKNSSQASHSEERLPKRSSLTELWRKKWNPNYKETAHQENATVCILKKCSEILNKIIVECMDGYSLMSFAALQCFNLIQT